MSWHSDPYAVRKALGEQIQRYRTRKRYSQRDLGKPLDADSTTISGWERGQQLPKAHRMMEIIEILGMPLKDTALLFLEAQAERTRAAAAAARKRRPRKRPADDAGPPERP